MNGEGSRPVPLLGEISLEFVQWMEHGLDAGFVPMRIAGLSGDLQQRSGRPSHRIRIVGVLFGEQAATDLSTLQEASSSGEELTFSSNITSALDLQQVVITALQVMETAGYPNRFSYEISLAESPPLPPPAQVEPFGGLGDFGIGDLGFDTDILDELQEQASEITGAIDDALDVIDKLDALANLDGLELGAFLSPLDEPVNKVRDIASRFGDAASSLGEAFST